MSKKVKKPTAATKPKQMTLYFEDTEYVQFEIGGYEGTATIDWGDGSPCETHYLSENYHGSPAWHRYSKKSNYTVIIIGENIFRLNYFEDYLRKLTGFDISKNTTLTGLEIDDSKITGLDVSKNKLLKFLYCRGNELTNLDVSSNTALINLFCNGNQLTSLDVSNNTAIEDLYCSDNNITNLNVCVNTALERLRCSNNALSELDVSHNTALLDLDCSNNNLSALDVSKNTVLGELNCSNNNLSAEALNDLFKTLPKRRKNVFSGYACLDTSGNPGTDLCDVTVAEQKGWRIQKKMTLTVQGSGEVKITIETYGYYPVTVDWGDNTDIESELYYTGRDNFLEFSHTYNDITTATIVITGIDITYLECSGNRIIDINVSNNTQLRSLSCGGNELTSLNTSNNAALTELLCGGNHITSLDTGKNRKLKTITCEGNELTYLDVSKNKALTELFCMSNNFSADALNDLFKTLPKRRKNSSDQEERHIDILDNPGTDLCDVTVAEQKEWKNINSLTLSNLPDEDDFQLFFEGVGMDDV